MMNIVLLGPPGAGKGTQAKLIKENLGLAHISTGDLLRKAVAEQSALGIRVKQFMEKGDLVPDELVVELLNARLEQADIKRGFILDGFPRNVPQAEILDKKLKERKISLDLVVYLKADEPVIIQRLSGRRVCPRCQANYHVTNMPPKKDELCDACGASLCQRSDDKEEAIKNRLVVYLNQTQSLIDYYRRQKKLLSVDANFDAKVVFERLKINLNDKFKDR